MDVFHSLHCCWSARNDMATKATMAAENAISPASSWSSAFLAAKSMRYVGMDTEKSKTCPKFQSQSPYGLWEGGKVALHSEQEK